LATVHDRDVLIFAISQLMAAQNEGRKVSCTLRFKAYDILTASNRGTDGRGYEQLRAAMERLRGTTITTNVTTGDTEIMEGFGLIDSFKIVRETRDGRMQDIEITLSDWLLNAVTAREVLTLHRNYFRLRKPLERRLYEIARKHCGQSASWKIGLQKLKAKCGSYSTDKEFRRLLTAIVMEDQEHAHIPDYSMELQDEIVTFCSRGSLPSSRRDDIFEGALDPEAYHDARTAAPGWDVYYIEREWRQWCGKQEIEPKRPGKHYVSFCKTWYENHGKP
jgi:hypothetical protein